VAQDVASEEEEEEEEEVTVVQRDLLISSREDHCIIECRYRVCP
jgi:hypothetical protein